MFVVGLATLRRRIEKSDCSLRAQRPRIRLPTTTAAAARASIPHPHSTACTRVLADE